MMRFSRLKGLSLIETLVALVMISLIFSAVTGLLMSLFNMRVKFKETTDHFNEAYLGPMWFQRSVQNLFFTKTRLEGDEKSFKGVTTYPLFGDIGEPHTFSWELEEDTDKETFNLFYKGIESQTALVEVFHGKNVYFEYFDKERDDWVNTWGGSFGGPQKAEFPLYIRVSGYENSRVIYFATLEPSRKLMKIEMLKAKRANYEKTDEPDTPVSERQTSGSGLSSSSGNKGLSSSDDGKKPYRDDPFGDRDGKGPESDDRSDDFDDEFGDDDDDF